MKKIYPLRKKKTIHEATIAAAFVFSILLFPRHGLTQCISTIAGNGTAGYTGDRSFATSALMNLSDENGT